MIKQLMCFMFGHRLKWRDEGSTNIGAAANCVRCGHEVSAVVWGGIHEGKTRGNIKPLMAESHRPAPPMPACKQPSKNDSDWQAEMLAEAQRTNELLQMVLASVHKLIP